MKLDDMKKITEQAKPGPWETPLCLHYYRYDNSFVEMKEENERFIAMARTAMPKLIAVAEAAKEHFDVTSVLDCYESADAVRKALEELEK